MPNRSCPCASVPVRERCLAASFAHGVFIREMGNDKQSIAERLRPQAKKPLCLQGFLINAYAASDFGRRYILSRYCPLPLRPGPFATMAALKKNLESSPLEK
jgi:hypothetical protein